MQIKKAIATGLAVLMAGVTVASPALAATALKDYPDVLASDGTLDAFVVVGKTAASDDVVGAVDIAVNLAGVSTVTKSVTTTATSAVDGVERDTITLPSSGSGALLSEGFPSSGVLKTFHYNGLKDSTLNWNGNDYDYHEQVDVSAVDFRHTLGDSNINGTEKMLLSTAGDVIYEYVFDKAINVSSASGTSYKGTIGNPDYSNPVKIKLLGKEFQIVGVGTGQIKVLQGSIGTATATSGVTYGDYTVYSDLGTDNAWARVIVKDADGNTVGDVLNIDDPDRTGGATSVKDHSASGLRIKVTQVSALQDGTVVGADLVVGTTSEGVEKTYDSTADVATGGATGDRFPGETDWGIQVPSTFGDTGATTYGQIDAADKIQIVYKPTTNVYKVAGEKLSLPGDYGDLGFEGWNTDKFATVTVKPVIGVAAYNSTDSLVAGTLNGFEISATPDGSIVSTTNNAYNKAYILFNRSLETQDLFPVMIGFYDNVKGKILVNDSISADPTAGETGFYFQPTVSTVGGEMPYGAISIDNTTAPVFAYNFTLSYGNVGEDTFRLNIQIQNNSIGRPVDFTVFNLGNTTTQSVNVTYVNKTAWTTNNPGEWKLGWTAASTEGLEVRALSESTWSDAGQASKEIVTDAGILLQPTSTYGAADQVVFKVPVKTLKIKAYFGKLGATTGGTTTYKEFVPITSAVAKLDSEVTTVEKTKNLVLVGGPCVNTLVADLAAAGKFSYTCASWPGRDFGLIQAVDDAFTTGKVALVVAGTRAADTRLASSVLQNYATRLSTVTGSGAEVTGTVSAPVVTAV